MEKMKAHSLFKKFNDCMNTWFDEIFPVIAAGVICFILVLSILLVFLGIPASAYDNTIFPFTLTITNSNNIPNDGMTLYTWLNNQPYEFDAFGSHTITNYYGDMFYTVGTDSNGRYIQYSQGPKEYFYMSTVPIPDGLYRYICIVINSDANNCLDLFSMPYVGLINDGSLHEIYVLCDGNSLTLDYVDSDGLTVFPQSYTFLVPYEETDPEPEPDPEPTCPTLQEQIANYNGSWNDFVSMLQSSNTNLYLQYQGELTDVGSIEYGKGFNAGKNSVTLGDKIGEFDGTWDEFVREIALNNVRLQTLYVNELTRVENSAYDDGFQTGESEGYTEGYTNGLNKGQSDNALKGFFGNFIDGVIEVLDGIHIYEEYEDGKLIFYISPWSIVVIVLMVAIVIIFLKVWLGG